MTIQIARDLRSRAAYGDDNAARHRLDAAREITWAEDEERAAHDCRLAADALDAAFGFDSRTPESEEHDHAG